MDSLLLLIGLVVLVALLLRPTRTQIVYVPVEPVERGGGGCLPLIVVGVGVLALLTLGVVR